MTQRRRAPSVDSIPLSPPLAAYARLITTDRVRALPHRDLSAAMETDRARVLFSPAFRRMQQKAQVFPLESNPAVRSRLSHSHEVAFFGRQITNRAFAELSEIETRNLPEQQLVAAINETVATACLLHDIGNPPFGHFGEAAIQKWFRDEWRSLLASALPVEIQKSDRTSIIKSFEQRSAPDLLQFDGNAQGFRTITKLQWKSDAHGLNLTLGLLAAYLKYTRAPWQPATLGAFCKKPGYFVTEAPVVSKIRTRLGLSDHQRHPLTFIMEAADDLAYSMSDIEDGIEKRLLTEDYVIEKTKELVTKRKSVAKALGASFEHLGKPGAQGRYLTFKTRVVSRLVKAIAHEFARSHATIVSGQRTYPLIRDNAPIGAAIELFKGIAQELYASREAEDLELAGYSVIRGILHAFQPVLKCSAKAMALLANGKGRRDWPLESRLVNLLPRNFLLAYQAALKGAGDNPGAEWLLRTHLIVDYVAGMTDDFALQTYQRLSGIRLDGR